MTKAVVRTSVYPATTLGRPGSPTTNASEAVLPFTPFPNTINNLRDTLPAPSADPRSPAQACAVLLVRSRPWQARGGRLLAPALAGACGELARPVSRFFVRTRSLR